MECWLAIAVIVKMVRGQFIFNISTKNKLDNIINRMHKSHNLCTCQSSAQQHLAWKVFSNVAPR